MKYLVVGASGFLGSFLKRGLGADGVSSHAYENDYIVDMRKTDSTLSFFSKQRYDVVINCAGFTNVDNCEKEPESAFLSNAKLVENIAQAGKTSGFKLIHISTDYVFDGEHGNYREVDFPNPINEYGKSKLIGEKAVDLNRDVILRISTPFGKNWSRRKKTFMEYVMENLSHGKKISVVTDQFTNPTYIADVLRFIKAGSKKGFAGIFHLGVKDRVSRYEFALAVAERFSLNAELIGKAKLSDLKFTAKRPRDTSFNLYKVGNILKIQDLGSSLETMLGD